MRSTRALLLAVLGLSLASSMASADKRKKGEKAKLGEYDGIRAGEAEFAPGARAKDKRGKRLYWVGFRPAEGGGGRVFLQLGREAGYRQWLEGDELVVHLEDVQLGNRNARRRLLTGYFDVTIASVTPKQVGRRPAKGARPAHSAGVQLRIRFKSPVDVGEASVTAANEQDGFSYLYLDFGKASTSKREAMDTNVDAADDVDADL